MTTYAIRVGNIGQSMLSALMLIMTLTAGLPSESLRLSQWLKMTAEV
jgi:hypothetical protein